MTSSSPWSSGASRQAGVVASEFILIAIVVVALLVVIGVSVGGIRHDARAGECRTELRELKVAVEQYQAETGKYPVDKQEVIAKGPVKAAAVANYTVALSADGTSPVFTGVGTCA